MGIDSHRGLWAGPRRVTWVRGSITAGWVGMDARTFSLELGDTIGVLGTPAAPFFQWHVWDPGHLAPQQFQPGKERLSANLRELE